MKPITERKMETCEVCNKQLTFREEDQGAVYYSEQLLFLCPMHYRKWSRVSRDMEGKFKKNMSVHNRCVRLEKEVLIWVDKERFGGV